MSELRFCYECSSSSGGPARAMVKCTFSMRHPGAMPLTMPDWAWNALAEAEAGNDSMVHHSVAQECDAFSLRYEVREQRKKAAQQARFDDPRDFNAPTRPGVKRRSLRERVERVNRLLKGNK